MACLAAADVLVQLNRPNISDDVLIDTLLLSIYLYYSLVIDCMFYTSRWKEMSSSVGANAKVVCNVFHATPNSDYSAETCSIGVS